MISKDNEEINKKKLFRKYYSSKSFLDNLILPPRANFHHFRCEMFSQGNKKIFRKIKNTIRKKEEIQKILTKWGPKNVYYTPTEWLDPINLRKMTDKAVSDVLLSCPLYFDVDANSPLESISMANKLVDSISKEYSKDPDLIVFSGRRGFHIYYWDWGDIDFNLLGPKERIETFIENRKKIVKKLLSKNIEVDYTVTADPWRILRLPGTLHGETNLASISIADLMDKSFIKKAKVLTENKYG